MKTPFILFLFAILFSVLLCEASKSPDPVHDINCKILRANTKYYIVPLHNRIGGGLDLALSRPRGDSCPQSVVQDDKVNNSGLAVQFYPVNSKKSMIRESTDLNIAFPDAHAKCLKSNVWTIDGDVTWLEDTQYITAGGQIGNPGEQTLVNWFKIVKTPYAYKLRFCPDVCSSCIFECQDVSVKDVQGKKLLVLSEPDYLEIAFREA